MEIVYRKLPTILCALDVPVVIWCWVFLCSLVNHDSCFISFDAGRN